MGGWLGERDDGAESIGHRSAPAVNKPLLILCLGIYCKPVSPQELGLIGLRIQRMATEAGREFNNPHAYGYLTVASPSCHDVTPLRAW